MTGQVPAGYETALQEKRRQRAAMLLADRSWLTLAGLYWLKSGENHFGKAATNDLVLPGATTPDDAGRFCFDPAGVTPTVTCTLAPGVTILRNGAVHPTVDSTLALKPDTSRDPDFLMLGDLTMVLIVRGARYGIRLWDNASRARQEFTGLRWYAIDAHYCIVADFVPYASPKRLTFTDVLGDLHMVDSPGYARFTWQGDDYCLDAQSRGERLFFNFGDATNGDSTYPAGRFLFADPAQQGKVTLDFNQATNPFCAYSPYATCPLPPPQNRLPIRIEAGEMNYP